MKKILAIAWKDVYLTFTDRNLLLIMIATPLLISAIIGMAFGSMAEEGGVPFSDIPVVIVNLDAGVEQNSQTVNYGQWLVALFIPAAETTGAATGNDCPLVDETTAVAEAGEITLDQLVEATTSTSADEARAAVQNGDYAAAVIIPADFTQRMIAPGADTPSATHIEIYGDSGQPLFASVIRSIVNGFIDRVLTGNIAIVAAMGELPQGGEASPATDEAVGQVLGCGFSNALNTVRIDSLPVNPDANALSGFGELLVAVGAAQAMFFALFTGESGVISILEERRTWTLQRLVVSPTPRGIILAGKLVGTFVTVLFQLVVLLVALNLVAILADGEFTLIWGKNIPALIVLVLAVGIAVCGFGILISGVAKTPEQIGSYGAVANIIMAMFGGAFGAQFGPPLSYVSLIHWGVDGFTELALGGTDIALDLAVLLIAGMVLFVIGWQLFNRRLDI